MSKIHFIPHVHWDREWLRSTDSSRIKLVYYFDRLIEMLENEQLPCFTFDGQTAALEDYLAIKPYQKEKISQLVKDRKLFIGPWYVQPDMIIPSGEALVRNLLIGTSIGESLGHCMNVGWVPDAFGQNQITPYLFKEIGMKGIFAWRGFDYKSLNDSLFMWDSKQNVSLPSVHYALGYGHYRGFPEDYQETLKDMETIIPQLEKRYQDEEILFMLGSDYAFPRYHTNDVINKLQNDGYDCSLNNPEDYFDTLLKKADENNHVLAHYQGEARSAALGRIHAGITSTRIDVKNAMRHYETLMSKVVEPMIGISRMLGGHCDQELVNYFWKIIFKNQFHDSIYGSSPDTINQTVENRLLNLRHGLNELIWMNMRYIAESVDLSSLNDDEDIIVLVNTLPYQRDDFALVSMIVKNKNFVLKRKDGTVVPYELMHNLKEASHEIEYYNGIANFHDEGEVLEGSKYKIQLKIDASLLPPMGYEVLKVCYDEETKSIPGDVHQLTQGIENTYLKVLIEDDGSITVTNKETNETYNGLNVFKEKGDDGDEYNYSPCIDDKEIVVNSMEPTITCIESSQIEVTYSIEYKINVPKKVVEHKRSNETSPLYIRSEVSLKANSHTVDFKTTIFNQSCDHIIRVSFDDLYESKENCSQDQFGSIIRPNIIENQKSLEDGATEYVLPIYAMQRYVRLNHNYSIMALISKGPLEYEIENNHSICLTLLRSVGKFGKADLLIRPGRSSGYRLETPSSQLMDKTITSEYSLFFGNNHDYLVQQAELINTPVQSRHLNQLKRQTNRDKAWRQSLLKVDERVELMAFKKAEKGECSIIRILNNREHDISNVKICVPKKSHCYLGDTRENKISELENHEGVISIKKIMLNTFVTVIIE